MKKTLKIFVSMILVSFCCFVFLGIFMMVYAQLPGGESADIPGGVPAGISGGTPSNQWSVSNFVSSSDFVQLVNHIADWIFTIAIPIAIIAFIWAGILFMTAGEDEQKVTTAKKAMLWSVIGLTIALLSKGFTSLIKDIIGAPAETLTGQQVVNALNRFANFLFSIALTLGIISLIYAGALFMTSEGDERKITTAKKAFWWSIVGITIAIASKGIIILVRSILKV